jgi:hypothetical protein
LKECIKWLQFTNPKNDTNSNDRKSNATKIDTGPDKGQPQQLQNSLQSLNQE